VCSEIHISVWKPFTYKSPEEASVVLSYGTVPWRGQAVLFVCVGATDRQQKAVLPLKRKKCAVRKGGHTDASFCSLQSAGGPILIMQSPGTSTLKMRIL